MWDLQTNKWPSNADPSNEICLCKSSSSLLWGLLPNVPLHRCAHQQLHDVRCLTRVQHVPGRRQHWVVLQVHVRLLSVPECNYGN